MWEAETLHELNTSWLNKLTIAAHTQSKTLLQPAMLAAITVGPINKTVSLSGAGVHGIVLLAASKETL